MKKRLVWLGALCLFATTAAARDLEDILKDKKIIDPIETRSAITQALEAAALNPDVPEFKVGVLQT